MLCFGSPARLPIVTSFIVDWPAAAFCGGAAQLPVFPKHEPAKGLAK
jgi:hypothetical protein